MLIHVLVLYVPAAAVVVGTIRTWGPRYRPLVSLAWPILVLGGAEILMLTARGKVALQWLVPLVALWFAALLSRSDRLVQRARTALIAAAVLCTFHAWALRSNGYIGLGPANPGPGRRPSCAWYTPLTGLRPISGEARWPIARPALAGPPPGR